MIWLNQRRRKFIDRPIQGTLLLHATAYWAATVVTQLAMVVFLTVIASSPGDLYADATRFWVYLRLMAVASALIVPMILLDLVRLSHRWVGPVYRIRAALNALSRGETIAPIRFREGDFWQEIAGDFNVVAAELNRLRATSSSGAAADTIELKAESVRQS